MKAITLWEPWATAIALGHKTYETRGWITSWRGEIAIHAAKTKKHCSFQNVHEIALRAELPLEERMALVEAIKPGHVVAVARIANVVSTLEVRSLRTTTQRELAFGDYGPGRYAWRLADIRRLPHPFEARGRQQIWNLTEEDAERVRAQLRAA